MECKGTDQLFESECTDPSGKFCKTSRTIPFRIQKFGLRSFLLKGTEWKTAELFHAGERRAPLIPALSRLRNLRRRRLPFWPRAGASRGPSRVWVTAIERCSRNTENENRRARRKLLNYSMYLEQKAKHGSLVNNRAMNESAGRRYGAIPSLSHPRPCHSHLSTN